MTFAYKALSTGLHQTADAAVAWFLTEWGLKKSRVKVEAEFDPDIFFRPTFVIQADDGHLLCIEVSENIYSPTLDSVVLKCLQKGLPVKLFIAAPTDVADPEYSRKLKLAKAAGVGVFEVNNHSGTIVQNAISLSLGGLRQFDLSSFPPSHRQALKQADQTFRDGQPLKACSLVYDELEESFRRFAAKCEAKNLWPNASNLKIKKVPWAKLLDDIDRNLDRRSILVRSVTPALVARIKGITTHRNDAGHKQSLKDRIKIDRALRTRFETGVDLLEEFLHAVRALRI